MTATDPRQTVGVGLDSGCLSVQMKQKNTSDYLIDGLQTGFAVPSIGYAFFAFVGGGLWGAFAYGVACTLGYLAAKKICLGQLKQPESDDSVQLKPRSELYWLGALIGAVTTTLLFLAYIEIVSVL